MIISASRRTDIPAYYSPWFFRRLEAGFVCVRNPVNFHQVSRVSLSPEVVDGIVFWTKNPIPMLDSLPLLKDYPFYFQFTLTAYAQDLEPGIPSKNDRIIPAFQELSRRISPERVIWRYDPILLTPRYTADYHVYYFKELAKWLSGYTQKCVISFVDLYRHLGKQFQPLDTAEIYELAGRFSDIAQKYHLTLETCAESFDLSQFGIRHGHCIDENYLRRSSASPCPCPKTKISGRHADVWPASTLGCTIAAPTAANTATPTTPLPPSAEISRPMIPPRRSCAVISLRRISSGIGRWRPAKKYR